MKVIWTPLAQEEYANILQYIDNNFGLDTTLQFLEKTEMMIERIQEFPKLFPVSKKSKIVRKATITKNISLLYAIKKQEVWILEFWDNRRNPNLL